MGAKNPTKGIIIVSELFSRLGTMFTICAFTVIGKPIGLDNEFCNGTFKPPSAEKQVGGSHQAEPVVTKTSSTQLSSHVQQQTNTATDILYTAV